MPPPRGPIDMLVARNCACDPVVAAATTITARAVEIDSNPICLNRLAGKRIEIPPRKIQTANTILYSDAFMAPPCRPDRSRSAATWPEVFRHPRRSVRDGLLEWR